VRCNLSCSNPCSWVYEWSYWYTLCQLISWPCLHFVLWSLQIFLFEKQTFKIRHSAICTNVISTKPCIYIQRLIQVKFE
jgi:hypothetical protein